MFMIIPMKNDSAGVYCINILMIGRIEKSILNNTWKPFNEIYLSVLFVSVVFCPVHPMHVVAHVIPSNYFLTSINVLW